MSLWYGLSVVLVATLIAVVALRWLQTTPAFALFLGTVIFAWWATVSCVYIEAGIYVIEQDRFSFWNGASAALVVVLGVFAGAARLAVVALPAPPAIVESPATVTQQRALLFVVIAALALLYLNLSLSPIPLLDPSVDRFDYWSASRLSFLYPLFGNTTSIIAFIAGTAFARERFFGRSGRAAVYCIVAYVIYLVLVGHKFGALQTTILLWIIPQLMIRDRPIRVRPRMVLWAATAIVALLWLAYYAYSELFNPYGDLDPLQAIQYRVFGLQGHLWWGAWQRRIVDHVPATLSMSQLMHGMETLISTYGTYGSSIGFAERGVQFTGGYPAIGLHVLPLAVLLSAQAAFGLTLGTLSWYMARLLRTGRLMESCLWLYLWMWFQYATTMGTFGKLVKPAALLIVGAIAWRELQLAAARRAAMAPIPSS